MIDNITFPNRDLFDVANADDGEKLELVRIGLIDLSVFELLEIGRRARSELERKLENEQHPRRRARLQATLAKVDEVRAANARMAQEMLDKQEGKLSHVEQTRRASRTRGRNAKRRSCA
jgi:hypothetical protein